MIASIFINGIIGESDGFNDDVFTSLLDVKRQFNSFSNPTSITAYINSVGGDAREGFAIKDFFRVHGIPVTTIAEGKVYSIASVIFLAGDKDKRFIRPHSEILIHNPRPVWGTFGDADEHEKALIALRSLEDELANDYALETNLSFDEAKAMMAIESRIKGQEAIDMGFASSVMEEMKAVALSTNFLKNNMSDKTTKVEELDNKGLYAKIEALFSNSKKKPEPVVEKAPEVEAKTDEKAPEISIHTLMAQVIETQADLKVSLAQNQTLIEENKKFKSDSEALQNSVKELTEKAVESEKQVNELKNTPVVIDNGKNGTSFVAQGGGLDSRLPIAKWTEMAHDFNNR